MDEGGKCSAGVSVKCNSPPPPENLWRRKTEPTWADLCRHYAFFTVFQSALLLLCCFLFFFFPAEPQPITQLRGRHKQTDITLTQPLSQCRHLSIYIYLYRCSELITELLTRLLLVLDCVFELPLSLHHRTGGERLWPDSVTPISWNNLHLRWREMDFETWQLQRSTVIGRSCQKN